MATNEAFMPAATSIPKHTKAGHYPKFAPWLLFLCCVLFCSSFLILSFCFLLSGRLESIKERRAAAKQANRDAAKERKEREAAQAEADRLQRERNNIAVRTSGIMYSLTGRFVIGEMSVGGCQNRF